MLLGLIICSTLFSTEAWSHDLSLKYAAGTTAEQKKVLENVMSEVAAHLPEKLKTKLPKNIEIRLAKLSNHSSIPDEVCLKKDQDSKEVKSHKKDAFIYGMYSQQSNALTINYPVLLELAAGAAKSKRINCQHKSLYQQAVATIIHELTHAYDFANGRVSNSAEFIRIAGFKKGLLKIKNKNIMAMRSADPYELVNIAESFAVNAEYFAMDPEFMCRKPSMFDFFKKHFEVDPFPTRRCEVNNTVMMTNSAGFAPTALDINRVYRIDYLMASSGKEAMSGFGHSMFRVVMCAPEHTDAISGRVIPATPYGKKCLDDKYYHLVISYRANVQDARLNYIKGIFGGYPSMLFILNFSDVLDEYNRDELRDVISYPLKLSAKERADFITRVKEEHWNYRGSYKFINNNCAVESYDLLKAAIDSSKLSKKSSLTPNGVLEDLDRMEFLSVADSEIETYKAQTTQLLLAYKTAYGYKPVSDKKDVDAVTKFIDKSTVDQRFEKFTEFTQKRISASALNAELHLMKERLVAASSFSVMEQQVLRTVALKLRKQVAEKLMKNDDPKVQKMIESAKSVLGHSIAGLSKEGYGIPFSEELNSLEDNSQNLEKGKEIIAQIESFLRNLMPKEYAQLEKMDKNIKVFNKYSLDIRKEYRSKLESYVKQSLKKLSKSQDSRSLLDSAANGDMESVKGVRKLLGSDLISEKEILDVKLQKYIQESL